MDFKHPYNKADGHFVSGEPYILKTELTPANPFLVIACDGLWDKVTYEEAIEFIAKAKEDGKDPTETSQLLVKHSLDSGSLDNITAIFDINRLGQSEEAPHAHDLITIKKKLEAFGWNTSTIDGHDISDIINSLEVAKKVKEQPTAIIAKTIKGKYFGLEIENQLNWHGKPLGAKMADVITSIKGMITKDNLDFGEREIPEEKKAPELPKITLPKLEYKLGDKIATRFAYGTALKGIGSNEAVVGLDGDTKNSTYSLTFKDAYPDRFIECYIAEQNMVGVAAGLSARNRIPFASTFGCFFTRAFDFIRMCAISQSNIKFCGSHSGVSIGEDGPSQMALEDLSMFRSVSGSVVLYPSDAVSCERAVELAANHRGIVYIRTSRPATPVIFDNEELFEIGKSKVVKKSETDCITVVAAGITLAETMKAYDILEKEGIMIRVIDIFSVKPVDKDTLLQSAKATNGLVLTVEDHFPEGGIRDAVSQAFEGNKGISLNSIAIQELPRSGKPEELIEKYGISASKIAEKVRALIKQ